MIYRFLLFIFIGFVHVNGYSQMINEAVARAEIEKRGYDADRFKQEMIKKGVNPDNINPDNPVEVARAKKAAEEVMAILDAEKKSKEQPVATPQNQDQSNKSQQSKTDNTRSADDSNKLTNQSKEIQKAVKEGATIEEAVSEKLQDDAKEKLPPAKTYGQHCNHHASFHTFLPMIRCQFQQ